MADLIDRGDFRQAFECVFRGKLDGMSAQDVTRRMRKLLKELPAVDAAPVVHSSCHSTPDGHVYCGSCRFPLAKTRVLIEGVDKYLYLTTKYCPNCGAKMDLEV